MSEALSGNTSNATQLTRDDLRDAGFSAEEIERMEQLRDEYPYIEFLDSRKEWDRLRFMKWLINSDSDTSDQTSES